MLSTLFGSVLCRELKQPHGLPSLGEEDNVIDALFGIKMEETLQCKEAEVEPKSTKYSKQHLLTDRLID